MRNYLINEILYESYETSNNSSINYQKVITNSFSVVKELNKIINDLYNDYYKQKDIYYSNVKYYKKVGGIFPHNTFRELLKDIDKLKEIKNFILDMINEIKFKKEYDLGYKSYIESLLNLMI